MNHLIETDVSLSSSPALSGNRLGALATGISEVFNKRTLLEVGLSATQISVLILVQYAPGISIDFCSKALGLSHSNLVRMTEGLVHDGLLSRNKSEKDKRATQLFVESAGDAKLAAYFEKKEKKLQDLLNLLSENEKHVLQQVVDKLLHHFPDGKSKSCQICRFCNMVPCHNQNCPVPIFSEN